MIQSSLIRRCDVFLNNCNITKGVGDSYFLKSYTDALLFSSNEEIRALETTGCTSDTAGLYSIIFN